MKWVWSQKTRQWLAKKFTKNPATSGWMLSTWKDIYRIESWDQALSSHIVQQRDKWDNGYEKSTTKPQVYRTNIINHWWLPRIVQGVAIRINKTIFKKCPYIKNKELGSIYLHDLIPDFWLPKNNIKTVFLSCQKAGYYSRSQRIGKRTSVALLPADHLRHNYFRIGPRSPFRLGRIHSCKLSDQGSEMDLRQSLAYLKPSIFWYFKDILQVTLNLQPFI